MRSAVLRYFGRISYALYIFHFGIYGLVDRALPKMDQTHALRLVCVSVLAFVISIAMSEGSWRLIESKSINRAHAKYSY